MDRKAERDEPRRTDRDEERFDCFLPAGQVHQPTRDQVGARKGSIHSESIKAPRTPAFAKATAGKPHSAPRIPHPAPR